MPRHAKRSCQRARRPLLRPLQRPLLAPMHVVRVSDIIDMTELNPHEILVAQGKVLEYDPVTMGDVIFVSHEWLSSSAPDPGMGQFGVLQQALRNLISGTATVQMCFYTARAFAAFYPTLTKKKAARLGEAMLWYDFFSIPQQLFARGSDGAQLVQRSVASIPAYIERCRWFFILAPFAGLQHRERQAACTYETWLTRGWCRLEQASHALSPEHKRVHIIMSPLVLEEKFPYTWVNARALASTPNLDTDSTPSTPLDPYT